MSTTHKMEEKQLEKIAKMEDNEFKMMLDALADNKTPISTKSPFVQELKHTDALKSPYDSPNLSRAPKFVCNNSNSSSSSSSNRTKSRNKSVTSADDCSALYASVSSHSKKTKQSKSTKSMYDLRDNPSDERFHWRETLLSARNAEQKKPLNSNSQSQSSTSSSIMGAAAECAPSTSSTISSPQSKSVDCAAGGRGGGGHIDAAVNNRNSSHCSKLSLSKGCDTICNATINHHQKDESDPSASIAFFPSSSSSSCSNGCTSSSQAVSGQPILASCSNNNNSSNSISQSKPASNFNWGNSLRSIEQIVDNIEPPTVPIYDSVNRSRIVNLQQNHPHNNIHSSHRCCEASVEHDEDKMEFGESHNLEHKSHIVEFRMPSSVSNSSTGNKESVDEKSSSKSALLPTPSIKESSNNKQRKKKKPQEQGIISDKIPGHVGCLKDIDLLDSYIKGEKNEEEIKKLAKAGKARPNGNGGKSSTVNGVNRTSPETAQDSKKLKKKLKKKLNRDNRSVSDKNLPVNKQNGKTTSKTSSDDSSEEAEEVDAESHPPALKSQSLYLGEIEYTHKSSQEDLLELQTVSDPELEREKEFVTPKGKSFKKKKAPSPKTAPIEPVFDSRKGFSKANVKRDVRSNGNHLHNGYESERDIYSLGPESLNLTMKSNMKNVIAPTSRVLPILLDEGDCNPTESRHEMEKPNIENGFFPHINSDYKVIEPVNITNGPQTLSYAQIAKNIAAAKAAAAQQTQTAAPINSTSSTVNKQKPAPQQRNQSKKSRASSVPPVKNEVSMNGIPEENPEALLPPAPEEFVSAENNNLVEFAVDNFEPVQFDLSIVPPNVGPLRVIPTGDNCFTVEAISFDAPQLSNDELDCNSRIMFGNFEDAEIDSVMQTSDFSPLDDSVNIPKILNCALSSEGRKSAVTSHNGIETDECCHSSSSPSKKSSSVSSVINNSSSSPRSSSNFDSSLTSSEAFEQNLTESSGDDLLSSTQSKVLKLRPMPNFVSCVSQLANIKYVNNFDKYSYNYVDVVKFVQKGWNEFSSSRCSEKAV